MTTTAPAVRFKSVASPARGRLKSFTPTSFKAAGQTVGDETLNEGEYIALAAVFGNIDSYGDRIVKGAFAETLEEWAASGNPIPVIWQHDWSDPDSHIGEVLWARETDEGLLYKARLDIDDNPKAAQVYRLMKGRRITQQSFGFDVIDGASIMEDEVGIFEIRKVHLYEVGPCLVGVNQATDTLDIKSNPTDSPAPAGAPDAAPAAPVDQPSQGEPAANPSSATTASAPSESASRPITPASVLLISEIMELEG